MKYSDTYSISLLCKVLNVSRASFYHFFYYSAPIDKTPLIKTILKIFFDSKMTYGAPRITAVLNYEGLNFSSKTVAKYMFLLGIQSITKSKFPKRKNRMSSLEKSKIINLIKHLDVIRTNQVWITDITYIKTKNDGWVYLSSILDLFSRKVIAWNIENNITKETVIKTLNEAFIKRNFPKNVIIHSDKGSQYRSLDYRKLVIEHHCLYSYTSLNHSCDENAIQESFHASIKKECLYHQTLFNLLDVKRACFEYIEGFYNSHRIHSALGFVSPIAFESAFLSHIPPSSSV